MGTRSELGPGESIHVEFTNAGKEPEMSEPKPAEVAQATVDAPKPELAAEAPKSAAGEIRRGEPGAVEAAEKPAEVASPTVDAEKKPEAPAVELADARAECKKFLDAFGPKGGEWFAAGKSFTEAQDLHAKDLRAENETLKARLAALDRGEKAPVTFQPEKRDDARAKRRAELKAKVGDNLAAFAAEIECKPSKE
jgi:hypothetical protein